MGLLRQNDKIFVAGHQGLVGRAITECLKSKGYSRLLLRSRAELDLEQEESVRNFFSNEKPDVVFVAAAKVGGIHANNTYRADFIYKNLQIQNHVIGQAHQHGVHRLVFLGSSCVYPRNAPQPMREDALLTSSLETTNRPYAIAKIAGLEFVSALRQQYGKDYFSVMPTNLFGVGDRYHPEDSHVLPALLLRFHEAKKKNEKKVVIWGTGAPLREFLFAQDCADAIVYLAEKITFDEIANSEVGRKGFSHVNIGSGEEVSIRELAKRISDIVGFTGEISFDPSRLDGTPRKLLDSSFLYSLGWKPSHSLDEGIRRVYQHPPFA